MIAKIPDFVTMTISQLVELFEKIGLEQDTALDYAQYDLCNQLYDNMLLVEQELKTIRTENWNPQAIDAGMILNGLDNGTFRPA